MKTLSFISGLLLALVVVTPSSAYFRTGSGPEGTVRMSYVHGRGIRVLSQRSSVQQLSKMPKYIVRTGSGIPTEWPKWIDPPSWIVGQ